MAYPHRSHAPESSKNTQNLRLCQWGRERGSRVRGRCPRRLSPTAQCLLSTARAPGRVAGSRCVWKSAWRDTVASGKVRGAQSVGSATVRGVQGVASREPPWRAPQCLASRAGALKAPWRPGMCVVLIRCPGRGGRHGRRHGGRRALLQSHATWRNNAPVIHSSSRTPGRHAPWRAQHSGGHARFWTPRTIQSEVGRSLET